MSTYLHTRTKPTKPDEKPARIPKPYDLPVEMSGSMVIEGNNSAIFRDKDSGRFYKVRDVNDSWVTVKDLRSLGYSKKLREGKFFRDEWVVFDYKKMAWRSKQVNKDGSLKWMSGKLPGHSGQLES